MTVGLYFKAVVASLVYCGETDADSDDEDNNDDNPFFSGHLQVFWEMSYFPYSCPTMDHEYLLLASSDEIILTTVKVVTDTNVMPDSLACGFDRVTIVPRDNSSNPYTVTVCDHGHDNPVLLFPVSAVYVRFMKTGDEAIAFGFRLTYSYHKVSSSHFM